MEHQAKINKQLAKIKKLREKRKNQQIKSNDQEA